MPVVAVLLALSLLLPAAGQSTAAAPVNALGAWDLTFDTDQGQIAGQLVLAKDGDKITGSISSPQGTIPVEADVDGKTLKVWFNYPGQDGPMPVEMTGAIDGDNLKGSFTLSGSAGGTFAGAREKDSSPAPSAATPAAAGSAASLTGTWSVSLQLDTISASPTLVLKQDGEKLSGDYTSEQYGKFPVTGTVKGTDVTITFSMSIQGAAVDVTYKGTIQTDGSLHGTAAYGDMMSGTFTATKKG